MNGKYRDSRILGNSGFVKKVLRDSNQVDRPRKRKKRVPLEELVVSVSEILKVDKGDLCAGDRKSLVSKARSVISYVAVREMGYSGVGGRSDFGLEWTGDHEMRGPGQ